MDTETIVSWIIAILPSIISVCTTIGIIVKTLKEFTALKKEVTDMKAMEQVREQLSDLIKENAQLKNTLNETLTKIDHIKRD